MKRTLLALASLAVVAAAYELRMNAGGPAMISPSGSEFSADATYGTSPAGFVGGESPPPAWDPIGGTDMPDLYRTYRVGLDGFIADVPDGSYVLTLHLCELEKAGPGLRIMGIVVEGEPIDTVDVFAIANHAYAVRLRYPLAVADGRFDLTLESLYRPTIMSGIELVTATPDTVPPPAPASLQARGGYGFAMLTWSPPPDDAAGVLVYRDDGGSPGCVTADPVPIPLLLDYGLVAPASYAARAIDVFGNIGEATAWHAVDPLALDDSPLPVYELHVEPGDLSLLQDDPFADTYVPARLTVQGVTYDPVGLRYRGNVARRFTKKSYKIRLEPGVSLEGASVLNLNADYADWSMLRARLGFALFETMGVNPPAARHVHLELNERFAGVYTHVEQIDEHFLRRTGRDTTSSIYKCNGNLGLLPSTADYERCYDKETNEGLGHDDLVAFIEGINLTGREGLPAFLLRELDVSSYVRHYAVIVATGNNDFTERNYYMVHDLARGRWEVLPWDLDLSFGLGFPFEFEPVCNPPIDVGTTASPQCIGGANMLVDRVLSVPSFRAAYCRALRHLLAGQFSPPIMSARIDSLHDLIAADAILDVLKLGREDPTLFLGSVADLNEFVAMRHDFLLGELAWFAPQESLYARINEVQPDNRATVADEEGEFDPWIELWNMSPDTTSLTGWRLSRGGSTWAVPDTTIGPGGRLLIWADGQPSQGPLHCSWRLDASGGTITIARPGGAPVDSVIVGVCPPDQAYFRCPDGGSSWRQGVATPDSANPWIVGAAPEVSAVQHAPSSPLPQQPVNVSARVSDPDGDLASVELLVDHGPGYQPLSMHDDGCHGDGAAGDSVFGVTLDGSQAGAVVRYVVRAEDACGAVTVFPSPASAAGWIVGFDPPDVRLNEFMASNDATVADEWGEFEDWVELASCGGDTLRLQGLFLTDDFTDPGQWPLPADLALAPGGFLVLWADGEPTQGLLHAPFRLDVDGECLGLFAQVEGSFVPVDTISFPAQDTDASWGRFPDATGPWGATTLPTPGAANTALGTVPVRGDLAIPQHPVIRSVWPNPFQRRVALGVGTPDAGEASLTVYDLAGRLASRAWRGNLREGWHTVEVEIDLPPGAYVATFEAPRGRHSRRVVIAPGHEARVFGSSEAIRSAWVDRAAPSAGERRTGFTPIPITVNR